MAQAKCLTFIIYINNPSLGFVHARSPFIAVITNSIYKISGKPSHNIIFYDRIEINSDLCLHHEGEFLISVFLSILNQYGSWLKPERQLVRRLLFRQVLPHQLRY